MAVKVTIKNQQGAPQEELELAEAVFGVEVNENCVRQTLNSYLNNQRQGTAQTKTRAFVSGGGKKPWKQKGTGRARAGSTRSPLWRGGAIIFGPAPRSYRSKVNKKVRRAALCSVLTARAQEGAITVLDSLDLGESKTKQVDDLLVRLGLDGKVLIVAPEVNTNLILGARNLPGIEVVVPENLNVYNLLGHEQLVFSKASVERVTELFA
ncbi:MAG: 50S ribosomal protein L4 [Candidatus Sumerlaeota bacterium]|nr:50S ribosomal protein L4 [Candidatus Sumerlaeota bacterium]